MGQPVHIEEVEGIMGPEESRGGDGSISAHRGSRGHYGSISAHEGAGE